jgi:hypothetical protein
VSPRRREEKFEFLLKNILLELEDASTSIVRQKQLERNSNAHCPSLRMSV